MIVELQIVIMKILKGDFIYCSALTDQSPRLVRNPSFIVGIPLLTMFKQILHRHSKYKSDIFVNVSAFSGHIKYEVI